MSYSSEHKLTKKTKLCDVIEFIKLLDYKREYSFSDGKGGRFIEFVYFEEKDYLSTSGVGLAIYEKTNHQVVVLTKASIARGYHDLNFQNFTIVQIRKRFGGSFVTDAGRGRLFRVSGKPPSPPASGCNLAFQRFGDNMFKADAYLGARSFPSTRKSPRPFKFLDEYYPLMISNNLLLPYLVAVLEDYYKSTFVALLKYSERKEPILKNARLSAEHLIKISTGEMTVEEAVSETRSFQNIGLICQHFKILEPKLNLAAALRKPYHGRRTSLFETLDMLVRQRHKFVHKGQLNLELDKEGDSPKAIDDLEEAVTRCYRAIVDYSGWAFLKGWYRPTSRQRKANQQKKFQQKRQGN